MLTPHQLASYLAPAFESCSASSRLRMKEPLKAAALFPTLTPPRGESGQKRTVGPLAQADILWGSQTQRRA